MGVPPHRDTRRDHNDGTDASDGPTSGFTSTGRGDVVRDVLGSPSETVLLPLLLLLGSRKTGRRLLVSLLCVVSWVQSGGTMGTLTFATA